MDPDKRKRLEEAGWQVGSVADFLGLTPEESIYIELRVLLAEALKAKRVAAKLSQQSFAKSMKSSQSRIAKAEANDPSVSLDLLVRSLIALGASIAELGKILEIKQASVNFDSVAANQSSSGTASQSTKRKQTKQPTKRATTKRARKGDLRAKKGTAKAA